MPSKASDSPQVERARKKLRKQFEKENQKIHPETLSMIRKQIESWLSKNSKNRINLKEKTITLFDANQHSESPHNIYVLNLLDTLKKGQKGPEELEASRVKRD